MKTYENSLNVLTSASDKSRITFKENLVLKVSSSLFVCIWSWTLIDVADMTNWALENIPVFFLVILLLATYSKFKFSDLSYILIMLFLSMHIYGAKYIYANNPLGFYLQEVFHSKRNQYDRIVHFSFGLFISYPIRDLCLNFFRSTIGVALLIPVICSLALGAAYEILEGAIVGIFFPEAGVNFLGIQGDIWDPQKDMFLAFAGSLFFFFIILIRTNLRK